MRPEIRLTVLGLLLVSFGLPVWSQDRAPIWSAKGVFSLEKCVPGEIEIRGKNGFPVLKDGKGESVFVAAGSSGKGRVAAFSHGSFVKRGGTLDQKPVADLLENLINWVSRNEQHLIGLHASASDLAPHLQKMGKAAEPILPQDLKQKKPGAYCLFSDDKSLDPDQLEFVLDYIDQGGGVILATTPWAFSNRYPDFDQSPGNRILTRAGLYFSPNRYASNQLPVPVVRPIESFLPSERTWEDGTVPLSTHPSVEAVRALIKNKYVDDVETQQKLIAEMLQGKSLGGPDIPAYLEALQQLNGSLGGIKPSRRNPVVPGKFPIVDAIIEMETHFNLTLPAGMMYSVPAADDFPGKVAPFAKEIRKKLTLNCNFKGWAPQRNAGGWNAKEIRPTGVYASPGKTVTLIVPEELAAKGYEIIIGSYGGGLQNRKSWHRYPRLQVTKPIRDVETRISNAFGGLVGIRIPRNASDGDREIYLSGGIAAPLYQHGVTSLADWETQRKTSLAPWAELASDRIIITVPSDHIHDLEKPDELMELWNQIIEKSAELAMLDRNYYRAERIVFDRQTAAGSLHSGYPVCGHIGEHSLLAVNPDKLKNDGFWGFFHEYGHNHQHSLWALPNTVETTCNLWSVYLYEELIGKPRTQTHGAISPLTRLQTRKKYFSTGADFEKDWSMWTALDTYLLIQEEFGWEPYQQVFAEYHNLPEDQWPKTQPEKNDQWVIRLSKACGMNLAPYWKIWNLPMSDHVHRELNDLPAWHCPAVAQWK
ncbi:MAG: M60 family metallopeptidase [Verrucomicrobiales bacterium]|nr:M60 family metallopeptidase [Verrucomicrobiales bacterium]